MEQKNSLAIASLVIGVLNLCAWLLPFCGLPLAVIGLVLGFMGLKSSQRRLALIGIALCSVSLLLALSYAALSVYWGVNDQIIQQWLEY